MLHRPLLVFGLLFWVPFMASQASATNGCGARTGGAAPYDQSTCGNVTPFPAAADRTAVSACGSFAAGTYHLTGNIGTAATATCLTFTSGPVIFDLAGFAITGRIIGNSIVLSGTHIYSSAAGGTLTCSNHSSNLPGCMYFSGSDNITEVLEFDHFTVVNIDSSSANSARNLMIDWGGATSSLGKAFSVKIHNITSTSATGTTSGRIVNLQIQASKARVEYNNNDVTCLAAASACQGMICYGTTDCKVHNNRAKNQLNVGTLETARAFLCDGDAGTGMNGCEIYNNYIDTQDGRAVRMRDVNSGVNTTSVHDNLIDNISGGSTGNYVAAIHLCDPDSGTNDGSGYAIFSNTFTLNNGNVVMARACANFPQVRNNRFVCFSSCSGLLGNVRQSGTLASTLQLTNNSPVPLTSSPQTNAETNTILRVCNSGSAGGSGTIKVISCTSPSSALGSCGLPLNVHHRSTLALILGEITFLWPSTVALTAGTSQLAGSSSTATQP
jgi:hypothetical protein